jgi:hypothetical protein
MCFLNLEDSGVIEILGFEMRSRWHYLMLVQYLMVRWIDPNFLFALSAS